MKSTLLKFVFVTCAALMMQNQATQAGAVIIVANGASNGPIITTSTLGNLDLGTRLRVGRFGDSGLLSTIIADYVSGAKNYAQTTTLLNSNFVDIGTGGNFGAASQTSSFITVDPSQFLFNTTANLTINGVLGTRNVASGQFANVNYSAATGIGNNSPLYLWTAFNNEIGIIRASTWNTPASDLSNLTINLSAITAANANSTVLLGTYVDNSTGNDFLALAVPEPSTGALMMIGAAGLVALRRLRKV